MRKAIIEARARAREKALAGEEARAGDMGRRYDQGEEDYEVVAETAHGYGTGYGVGEVDPDAMDLG